MKDFSWKYFSMTGDVDAYLLYKQVGEEPNVNLEQPDEEQGSEAVLESSGG